MTATTPGAERQSCLARMLDVRGFVLAARVSMSRADGGAALALMAVFGLIALVLLPIWISFDLASTWAFTTGARDASAPVVSDLATRAQGILGVSVAAFLAGFILTSFTLLPTLFELAFPSVNHPLLNTILLASIAFDFTTDWAKSWETAAAWTSNPLLHFIYAAAFCLFVSVIVQALLVVCVTFVIYGAITLVRGPGRVSRQTLIVE